LWIEPALYKIIGDNLRTDFIDFSFVIGQQGKVCGERILCLLTAFPFPSPKVPLSFCPFVLLSLFANKQPKLPHTKFTGKIMYYQKCKKIRL